MDGSVKKKYAETIRPASERRIESYLVVVNETPKGSPRDEERLKERNLQEERGRLGRLVGYSGVFSGRASESERHRGVALCCKGRCFLYRGDLGLVATGGAFSRGDKEL